MGSESEWVDYVQRALLTVPYSKGEVTGFFVSKEGYLLTGLHALEGRESMQMELPQGYITKAELKGIDSLNNLALLKIEGQGFTALSLAQNRVIKGDSIALIQGMGEKSLKKGSVTNLVQFGSVKLAETDVSIDFKQNGGPVLNKKGEVVGLLSRPTLDPGESGKASFIPNVHLLERLSITLVE